MMLLKIIMAFTKGEKFTEQVTINMEDDQSPIEFIYTFGTSSIKFYTSPQDIEE